MWRRAVLPLTLLACNGTTGLDGTVTGGPEAGIADGPRDAGQGGRDGAPASADGASADAASADVASADAAPARDGGSSPPLGTLSGTIRVNHFGWRPSDRKVAVLLGNARAMVELRRAGDSSLVATYAAGAAASDEDSGDSAATVDFSSHSETGDFYLYLPSRQLRSYDFRIAEDVYDIVGEAAVKSYYYQRCNHDRALPYASDRLGGFAGNGGQWVDGLCHGSDSQAPPGPGSPDHGPLDVRGGWHDAGDYQKTLWGRGVPDMLFAYEMNPSAWRDGQLNIPESGNGIPDLLDEVRWELDFYVRMQRPDGHFMSSAKGRDATVASPPSASNERRVYFDTTAPSGGGWSGGGVTLAEATGNAVMSLAHAAIVFDSIGRDTIAAGYRTAALAGWRWLDGMNLSGGPEKERRLKASAASAVYRMDSSQASARAFVEAFPWGTWDGQLPYSVTPADSVLAPGAWHYLSTAAGSQAVKSTISEAVRRAFVERAFSEEGVYGGMFGGPGNAWDWSWGSNRAQSSYGSNLLMAVRFGALGARRPEEVTVLAERHFHFLLGLNPLNMVYLTNMAAYGGEHSSFQLYHSWFSYAGGDGDHGNPMTNGKPTGVVEPLYPYHPDDTQTSTYGPAPGLIPGGPNSGYSCSYDIPNKNVPAYAYRDFSVGCDWDGSTCRACSWEITEPMVAYQGPFILLVSFMMSGS